MDKKKLIGFYDYTVVLTYMGMISAFLGIMLSINGLFLEAVICLMFAGLCDMFDGAVASTKKRNVYEKNFGIQIDSLSDLISFGVLPGIFVFQITNESKPAIVLSCMYVLCALIRLAYFNVQEAERQQQTTEKRERYLGVPVTTIALLLPIVYICFENHLIHNPNWFVGLIALLSIGFVSGFEVKKPKKVGKICIILVGLAEIIGIALLIGVHAK